MTVKSMMYDNPAYLARIGHSLGVVAAGSGALTAKFIAWAALTIFSVTATLLTAGTSTYTLWNGTATVTSINGQTLNVIRIFNTAAAGAAPAMATATYGPFVIAGYNGTATGTQTSAIGVTVNVALSGTGTGAVQAGAAAAAGGFPVTQGDQLYCVTGTDATAVSNYTLEYGIQPLASVTS
jgi:hypothetical protein